MRAVIVDPSSAAGIRLGAAAAPSPSPAQAVVRVTDFALVARSTRYARTLPAGAVPGFDAAGVIERAAADGSGPPVGTQVLTLATGGAWAELRAVAASDLAIVPPEVDLGRASAMATPAASALRALRRLGPLLGKRILVTGAAGAVGWFAIQLAHRAGAEVVAAVRSVDRAHSLRDLGAAEVVTELAQVRGRVAGAIDTVGGRQLLEAFQLLDDNGVVLSVGASSNEPTIFPPYSTIGARRSLESLWDLTSFGSDLHYLLGLASRGQLALLDGERDTWTNIAQVGARLAAAPTASRALLSVAT